MLAAFPRPWGPDDPEKRWTHRDQRNLLHGHAEERRPRGLGGSLEERHVGPRLADAVGKHRPEGSRREASVFACLNVSGVDDRARESKFGGGEGKSRRLFCVRIGPSPSVTALPLTLCP